ncbi:hypothetical protein STA3757_08230 [Stanieria sp. NIES-3757]|nr:hypothetical protein STA3757_08230 [Stanieria sp. NIES-3757]
MLANSIFFPIVIKEGLKPIQAEDEIILVSEYAAFPLRLIRGLEQMRGHYQRQKTYGKGFLHNDYRTQFIDLIPPDGWEMKRLQDIFYPALAFELLPYNSDTQEYEFRYYDKFRDAYEVTSLSYVWDEALEKLASIQDMVTALDKKLKETIPDLTQNPQKWNNDYLPKLREFVTTVDNLPENDPNYLYKEIVVGTRASVDRRQQDGIINRFWQNMLTEVEKVMSEQKQKPAGILTPDTKSDTALLETNISGNSNLSNSTSNTNEAINTQQQNNNSVLDAEFTDSNNSKENSSIIETEVTELEKLVQMKKEGFLSDAQFEAAKNKILGI